MKKGCLVVIGVLFSSLGAIGQSYWVDYSYIGFNGGAGSGCVGSGLPNINGVIRRQTHCMTAPEDDPAILEYVPTFIWDYHTRHFLADDNCTDEVITARDDYTPPNGGYSYSSHGFVDNNPGINLDCILSFPPPNAVDSEITLTVEVKPIIYIADEPDNNSICESESIHLEASGKNDPANLANIIPWSVYQWYYSFDAHNWVSLGSRFTSQAVDIDYQNIGGLNFGTNVYFAVATGGTLDQMHFLPGTSNESKAYQFYPAPPSISLSGTSPACSGGEGSILVEHAANVPADSELFYTITKLVPQVSGSCPSYSDGTPRDPVTGANGVSYCEGFVATWRKTFGAGDSRIIDLGSITPESVTGGDPFNLGAGYFEVLVESSSSASGGVPTCFAASYVVITDPPAMQVSVSGRNGPSCFGGSDGSATFTITNGDGGYDWSFLSSDGTHTGNGTWSGAPY
ncbi:MAG: hypothetical protein AAGA66_13755, partial [Bacteroidota bacterium]